jgi:hypothetical protein
LANPKERERMIATSHTPKANAKRSESLRRTLAATPELRERQSEASKRLWADRAAELAELRALKADNRNKPKPGGRPRKNEVRSRVIELRLTGLSWGQIQTAMNRETGERLTANAYRNLVQRT